MILIGAEVKGEPDVPPFRRYYECQDELDEKLFVESIERIKDKLSKNLKINTNESLALYCCYMIEQLRNQVSIPNIERNASKLLRPTDVMIGVPETLRNLSFDVTLDDRPRKKILLHEPIPIIPQKMQSHL
jgi:urease subunit gamma